MSGRKYFGPNVQPLNFALPYTDPIGDRLQCHGDAGMLQIVRPTAFSINPLAFASAATGGLSFLSINEYLID